MDIKNTPKQHAIVALFSLVLVLSFKFLLHIEWSTSLARTSFILLFLTLLIGPIMRLKKPTKISSPLLLPWSWRGELGIWFTITAIAHFLVVLIDTPLSRLIRIGGSGFSLANLLGLAALFWAILLTTTSFNKIIKFLGVSSWKWLHSLTYVIFYLVSGHYIYFQFFSTYGDVGPDWFGYIATTMTATIILLQLITFIVVVKNNRIQASTQ